MIYFKLDLLNFEYLAFCALMKRAKRDALEWHLLQSFPPPQLPLIMHPGNKSNSRLPVKRHIASHDPQSEMEHTVEVGHPRRRKSRPGVLTLSLLPSHSKSSLGCHDVRSFCTELEMFVRCGLRGLVAAKLHVARFPMRQVVAQCRYEANLPGPTRDAEPNLSAYGSHILLPSNSKNR